MPDSPATHTRLRQPTEKEYGCVRDLALRQHDMIGMAAYLLMAILAVVVLVPG
ncbi:hypothetical protein NKH33_21345 [Mesorhizobium sp. M1182]|uniref:hypothetical protein n=1 Tax=Mesorhizobium sp. M1182 TaxID=2957067 RepID=UPI0033387E5A